MNRPMGRGRGSNERKPPVPRRTPLLMPGVLGVGFALAGTALTGCDDGSHMDRAGEHLEDAAEATGEALEETGEAAREGIHEATEDDTPEDHDDHAEDERREGGSDDGLTD